MDEKSVDPDQLVSDKKCESWSVGFIRSQLIWIHIFFQKRKWSFEKSFKNVLHTVYTLNQI